MVDTKKAADNEPLPMIVAPLTASSKEGMKQSSGFRLGDPIIIADDIIPAGVSCVHRSRNACGHLLYKSTGGLIFQAVVLLAYLVVASLEANHSFKDVKTAAEALDVVADRIFLIVFTLLVGAKLFYLVGPVGVCCTHYYDDGRCGIALEVMVVVLSWTFQGLQVFLCLDLIRIVSDLTGWSSFRLIRRGFAEAAYPVTALLIFQTLWIFVCSVSFTFLFKDRYDNGYTSENYFGTLGLSFFTLVQIAELYG